MHESGFNDNRLTPDLAVTRFKEAWQRMLGCSCPMTPRQNSALRGLARNLDLWVGQYDAALEVMFTDDFHRSRASVDHLQDHLQELIAKGISRCEFPKGTELSLPHLDSVSIDATEAGSVEGLPRGLARFPWSAYGNTCRIIADAIASADPMLFVFGPTGTGKSTMLAAAAMALAKKEPGSVRWFGQPEFVQMVGNTAIARPEERSGSWGGNTCGSQFLNQLMHDRRTLFLDDVIHNQVAQRFNSCIVELIQNRSECGYRTVVMTNLSLWKVAERYGKPLASRLSSGAVIKVVGPDRRGGRQRKGA